MFFSPYLAVQKWLQIKRTPFDEIVGSQEELIFLYLICLKQCKSIHWRTFQIWNHHEKFFQNM